MNDPRKLSLLLGLVLVPACSSGASEGGAAPGDIARTIEDVLARGGSVAEPAAEHDARPEGAATQVVDTYQDGTEWDCTVQKMSIQQNPDEFVSLDPTTGVIYPGALLQGSTLLSSDIRPINVKRGPGRIVYDVVVGGGARDVQKDLGEVTFGNVVQAQDDLLTQLNDTNAAVPARLSTSVEIFDSTEELAAAMHLSTKLLGAKFKASVEFSKEKRVSRVVGQLTQTYFTVKFERPASKDDFFAAGTTPAELAPFVGKGNPATYVDTVTYGRRAYFIVESESSKQALKAAVEAKFGGTSIDGQLALASAATNASIRFVAMGGPSSAVLDAMATGSNESEAPLDTFKQYLANQDAWVFSKANPPVPIAYVVRNVTDDAIVKMDAGTAYETKSCSPRIGPTKVALSLDAGNASFAGDGTVSGWKSSTTTHGPTTISGYARTDLNGRTALRTTSDHAAAKGMDCGFLVDADYSIAYVTSSGFAGGDLRQLFTSGTDTGNQGQYLYLGWSGEGGGKLAMGHLASDQLFAYNSTGAGAVIVTSFTKGSGFSAWANGIALTRNGIQGEPGKPFTGSSACAIGTTQSNGYGSASATVAEVRGYRGTLTDSERQVVECELAAKWGIPMGTQCFDGKAVSHY